MKVRVYPNRVTINGYVNVCERISKKLCEQGKEFYEKIREGAFNDAISRNNNIKLLLNHDYSKELANTSSNLTLYEDSIGLYAEAEIRDMEVVEKAKNGQLHGWSFGFVPLKETSETLYRDLPLRSVEYLNLYEVSILDNEHIPAYNSMSLNVRSDSNETMEIRSFKDVEVTKIDNDKFINEIKNYLDERK